MGNSNVSLREYGCKRGGTYISRMQYVLKSQPFPRLSPPGLSLSPHTDIVKIHPLSVDFGRGDESGPSRALTGGLRGPKVFLYMEPISSENRATSTRQKAEAVSHLREGISLLLSRWTVLQMAIQNEWGGRDSLQKSQQLTTDILSWFFQSNAQLYAEDLENLLHESMLFSFNTEIEDGSIEEVAEQLMIMHEEYRHGNH